MYFYKISKWSSIRTHLLLFLFPTLHLFQQISVPESVKFHANFSFAAFITHQKMQFIFILILWNLYRFHGCYGKRLYLFGIKVLMLYIPQKPEFKPNSLDRRSFRITVSLFSYDESWLNHLKILIL